MRSLTSRRVILASMACGCVWMQALCAGEVHTIPPKIDLEALVAQLRSDDAEARDLATKVLCEHALTLWDKLIPLAAGDDPEVRARVRGAMTRAAIAQIPTWIKDTEKAVNDHDQYKRDFQKALQELGRSDEVKALEAKLADLARAEATADEKQRGALAAMKTKLEDEAAQARQDALGTRRSEYHDLRIAYLKKDKAERGEALRLRTRWLQLFQLRADPTISLSYRSDMQQDYDPRLLPFEKRLGLVVCYECLDETFGAAMARIGGWAGIEIVIAPEVSEEKRVHALADQRSTEQDVRSLVAGLASVLELDCRVDAAGQRISIVPKGK